MRSRLGWGLVADIHPTTYELRHSILEAKAEQMEAKVAVQVIDFLADRITPNVRELECALLRPNAHAELVGPRFSVVTAQEVQSEVLRHYNRRRTNEEDQEQGGETQQTRST